MWNSVKGLQEVSGELIFSDLSVTLYILQKVDFLEDMRCSWKFEWLSLLFDCFLSATPVVELGNLL